ncbi:phosphate acetyltransferase [Halomonas koreensis]|uniref:Phosphate acetyltransferase n=1 Tax=Halomonas koreensis TaxID=245385 RepID=A0ABU1G3M0_9GAMM|nr:phosphate acetyltransferase [Halomonas koreensis]MDR5867500.1 phosphate acetyltransferase [Halomonas koreensis]
MTVPEPRTLLLVPTDTGVGLTSASLGLLRALDTLGLHTAFLKPFRQDAPGGAEDAAASGLDRSSALVAGLFGLTPPAPLDRATLERRLREDRLDDLMEHAVARHAELAAGGEPPALILVEGLAPGSEPGYAARLNAQLAHALDAGILLVADGDPAEPRTLAERLDLHAQAVEGDGGSRLLGCLLMRLPADEADPADPVASEVPPERARARLDEWRDRLARLAPGLPPLVGAVPFQPALSAPRTLDVARELDARLLHAGDAAERRVLGTHLCARSAARALHVFAPGRLIVAPGDRDDILLATALAAMNGTPLAGLLLTHGAPPEDAMIDFCRPALETGLPVLAVDDDSYATARRLDRLNRDIPVDDPQRAERVARFVAAHLDLDWLRDTLSQGVAHRLSPAAFRHRLVQLARRDRRRVVLPEGDEPRTLAAAIVCQRRGIADCVLLGRREALEDVARRQGLSLPETLTVIDPEAVRRRYVAPMVARREGRLDALTAEAQLHDPLVLGTMMLAEGEVDGLVAGARHTTANVLRPAFQLIGTAPGYRRVSSIFFMLLPEQVVVYGDCAVNPDPDAETLAEIALQSARSAAAFGIEPRVALLSYSTGASGEGAGVDKVREATRLARRRAPSLILDGPLQYDAAAIESVGRQKAPDSPVAGRATVFVFPDLNTGNTTYKAVQRSAHVVSVGPMLQGLAKPVNDLSRGATVDDIVYTIALTAIQAGQDD